RAVFLTDDQVIEEVSAGQLVLRRFEASQEPLFVLGFPSPHSDLECLERRWREEDQDRLGHLAPDRQGALDVNTQDGVVAGAEGLGDWLNWRAVLPLAVVDFGLDEEALRGQLSKLVVVDEVVVESGDLVVPDLPRRVRDDAREFVVQIAKL